MEYLIKNTTKEQRKQIVKEALAISLASNQMPSDEILEMTKEYIDGKTELKDLQKKVIDKYRK